MRAPVYGELQINKASSPIRTLWYSKDDEPEPVEFYQLCDREWQDPSDIDRALDRRITVLALLDRLRYRSSKILILHYVYEMTLEEIADELKITSARVRQIEMDAIRQLNYYWKKRPDLVNEHITEYREKLKEKLQ